MAFVIRTPYVSLDGTDVSSFISEVQVNMTAADVDVTASGSGGRQHLAGIRDDNFQLTAFSAFGASSIDSVINPKFQAAGTLAVIIGVSSGTGSTLNPKYSGSCPLLTYSPLAGKIGDAATTTLTLPVSGTITVSTT
jgi:hypothetical protein